MKKLIKSTLRKVGVEITRTSSATAPGGSLRPFAELRSFLEDIRARGFRPRGIVDVGANRGEWTRLALSVFEGVPIIMIEPQAEMEQPLSELVAQTPHCHYIKAGAGREKGKRVQTIWDDLLGSSFLPALDEAKLKAGKQRETPMVAIDELLSAPHKDFEPDLVKLDIQGFELEALSGAQTLFGRTEVFILEASLFRFNPGQPLAREVIMFMADRGYELYDITEQLRRPSDGALGQLDLAFVKASGMFRRHSEW